MFNAVNLGSNPSGRMLTPESEQGLWDGAHYRGTDGRRVCHICCSTVSVCILRERCWWCMCFRAIWKEKQESKLWLRMSVQDVIRLCQQEQCVYITGDNKVVLQCIDFWLQRWMHIWEFSGAKATDAGPQRCGNDVVRWVMLRFRPECLTPTARGSVALLCGHGWGLLQINAELSWVIALIPCCTISFLLRVVSSRKSIPPSTGYEGVTGWFDEYENGVKHTH